jgi:hypothetical protein
LRECRVLFGTQSRRLADLGDLLAEFAVTLGVPDAYGVECAPHRR